MPLVLIDTHAYIGHWGFRPLPWRTAEGLLREMDRHGIDQAWVASISSVLYRNAHAGNEELHAEVEKHRDRLVPFAVINPTYADWEHDLAVCHEEFGCRGVRLFPPFHRYALADTACHELVEAATARNLVISVPHWVEDDRERSWLITQPGTVPVADMAALAQAFPNGRFVFHYGLGFTETTLGQRETVHADFGLDISRLPVFVKEELPTLIASIGAEHLVFGSGIPLTPADVPLYKLEVLDVPQEVKELIRWRNAQRLLGV
jgi:hypothetical protein